MSTTLTLLLAFGLSYGIAGVYALLLVWTKRYQKRVLWLLFTPLLLGGLTALAALGGQTLERQGILPDIVPPFVFTETLKGVLLLLWLWTTRYEMESLFDGGIYAILLGLSFEAFRSAVCWWGHLPSLWCNLSSSTLFPDPLNALPLVALGLGFGLAWQHRGRPFIWLTVPGGWLLDLLSLWGYRSLITSLDAPPWVHLVLPGIGPLLLLGIMAGWHRHETHLLRQYLHEEVTQGLISPAHYDTVCSISRQFNALWKAYPWGRGPSTARFYTYLTRLAFLKERMQRRGATPQQQQALARLRREVALLAPQAEVG